jgi:RND family efflux transporter MFP subunit
MKPVRPLLVLAGALAALAAAGSRHLFAPGDARAAPNPGLAQPAPIAPVAVAARHDLTQRVTLTAELRPYQEVSVFAKVSGYLRTMNVDYGDKVKAGQVLATLETPEQREELVRAEAAFRIAKLDYERMRAVAQAQPTLLAQAEIDKVQAAFETARANRDRERVLLSYADITAPFDGVISDRFADPGALIQAGTSSHLQAMPIVRLSDSYRLRLVVQVPEALVPKVAVGMPVSVRLQATDRTIPAKVARLSPRVTDNTRTMHVEIDLDNRDLAITPGMYAWVDLPVESRTGALAVPPQALAGDGQTRTAWVVGRDGRLEERAVATGLQTADLVEVTNGLALDDMVLFGSRTAFSIGEAVTPKPVAAPASASVAE